MNILTGLSEFVTGIPALVVKVIVMLVASFYMTADYDRIMEAARKIAGITITSVCLPEDRFDY
ncbi:hypothetical protein BRYFOR_09705 [Marvinbryantia formatexigens DSM 14469]|uniref:Uncharacterized protein n=1 Tax=Marvinbryantia formatexigens DSM 14469 TaxID=478749 RepID=C6LM06_9FIRM|nr:hypothetical protein [Marvinbryantia formatexigens]EET58318.1 hypothetical protein BRYFOR_09705 [Marvinbryantia formatexigens DSM 14469]UWO23544.1 hypothetical protein NQ534_13920 [Marvinbryantia formatexigens DSM 14469]